MNSTQGNMGRRDFLKALATLGLASMAIPRDAWGEPSKNQLATVPTRPFGKTGYTVSILSLGGMFDIPNNQLLLRRALQMGVTYWDTADCYEGGRSEQGIGRFFASAPDARKKIFLVTKSDARDSAGMTQLLNRSLERMNTDYIDLYFIHGLRSVKELSDDVKTWAERAKQEGKIRLFGFSTHTNMAQNLAAAAKLGWVDGIMFTYNFRIMNDDNMKHAVDACAEAGIGLTAMKTQGGGPIKSDGAKQKELAAHFLAHGFTPEQAKLKAVWSNPQIASICSQMPNLKILNANIAAALDRVALTEADQSQLQRYAELTATSYCAACAVHCEKASGLPIHDIMRCMMYDRDYGMSDWARGEFSRLSHRDRKRLSKRSLAAAETACPHRLPIRSLVAEALHKWGNPVTS